MLLLYIINIINSISSKFITVISNNNNHLEEFDKLWDMRVIPRHKPCSFLWESFFQIGLVNFVSS